ncbi:MAG TPA: hypothetical protein VGM72_14445 [Micropepsaceae bacterium]|jgi:hypothetical protein
MTRIAFLLCGVALTGLSGCASSAVRPSPTTDQVMAEQYRAQGEHGSISGPETAAIADAYRKAIGKSTQAAPNSEMRNDVPIENSP